jgi:TolB-like protein
MIKNSTQKIFMAGLGLFIALALCPVSLEAAQREIKVAVLPFDISSAGPFSYVGPATEEVLSNRLALDSISVTDSLEIQRITGKRQGFISPLDARGVAGKLGVDYVVTGKIIAEGENVTIDMDLLQADSESPLFSLVFSPASLDEVPPRIEGFATQAANHILNGPKSVTAEPDAKDEQKAPQELSQKETAQDEDLIIARMHPDLLIRQSDKDSGKPDRISTSSDQESYTQKLPVMPPEPLPVPAEDDDDILLPDYPPPPDEPIHYTDQTQETSEEQTASTSLPGSEQLVLPQPPVKEEKKGWFSWIKKPWGSKDTSAQSTAPASTLPYPPPETETAEEQVAAVIPQTSSTEQPIPAEQPIPTDGPIWQWY